jgi:hypothetical protein
MKNICEAELGICFERISQLENELEKAYRDDNGKLIRKYFSELENLYQEYRNLKQRM